MKPIRRVKVRPSLPSQLLPLLEIAHNLRWSWDYAAIQLFLASTAIYGKRVATIQFFCWEP
jgi:hypothetical protein